MKEQTAKVLKEMAQRGRDRRKELGLTVNQVAVAMGRTYQCVQNMERGGTKNVRVVLEWADALRCSPSWLSFGTAAAAGEGVIRTLLGEAAKLLDARQGRRKALVAEINSALGA